MCIAKTREKLVRSKVLQPNQLQLFPDYEIDIHHQEPLLPEAEIRSELHSVQPKTRKKRRYFPKIDISTLQRHAEELGGRCLSPKYITAKTKYLWECKEGHIWPATWDCVGGRGSWCHECRKRQSGLNRRKYNISYLKRFAESKGGRCHAEKYEGLNRTYNWSCAAGHTWTARWCNIIHNKTWCPYCSPFTGERICREFFQQLFNADFPKEKPEWLTENGRTRLELDGYCQKLGVAFEHQGTQHYIDRKHFEGKNHGANLPSKFEAIKRRDAVKVRACRERGIVLLQVPSILEGFGIENVKPFIKDKLLENYYPLPPGFDQIEVDPDVSYNFNKLEEIRRIVEAKGGELLPDVYISSNTKYKVKCQEGHIWPSKGDNIKQGKWCKICAGIANKTLEDVQLAAAQHGGKCLATAYVNNRTLLEFKCSKGHSFFALPSNVLSKKSWCKKCSSIERGKKKRKYDLESAQLFMESRGGRFLSDTFSIARKTYKLECDKGHTWSAVFSKVLLGDWCPHCAGNARKSIEDLHRAAAAKGGSCLSTEYKNIKTHYDWRCKEGHEFKKSAESVLRGNWCSDCSRNSRPKQVSKSSP